MKVHQWYPSVAFYEFDKKSLIGKGSDKTILCLVCGELTPIWCNFVGQTYQECEHCKGYTLHQTNALEKQP